MTYNTDEVITNSYQQSSEGFGTQYLYIINSLYYAELANKRFLYTPFQEIAHNYDNDPNYAKKKDQLIHFIDYFPINYDLDFQKKNQRPCLFPKNAATLQSYQIVKSIFFSDKKKENYFNGNYINIAIHIRRLNSIDTGKITPEISDATYCALIKDMRKKLPPRPLRFHIYSQGKVNQFKAFASHDIFLHLNESTEDTFIAMALADILIMAPSCLSYTAGIVSNGIVCYFPGSGRDPYPHWQAIAFK
jgi:hypothetical protein